MLAAACALGALCGLWRLGGNVYGLLWEFCRHKEPQLPIFGYRIPLYQTASFLGPRIKWWLSRLRVTPRIRAVAWEIVVAWSAGSWILLLLTVLFPKRWPAAAWWKQYVEELLEDKLEEQVDQQLDANQEGRDEENKEEKALPKEAPYGLLLVVAYGMGLWCGLWLAYMGCHRAVVGAVSWSLTKGYDKAVTVMLDSTLSASDAGEGFGALNWTLG